MFHSNCSSQLEFETPAYAHEKAIDYQLENLGVPRNSELIGRDDVVFVNEYIRGDGTVVRAHLDQNPEVYFQYLQKLQKMLKKMVLKIHLMK